MSSLLSRLRGRSPAELLDRARQGAVRWLERRGLGDVGEPDSSRHFTEDASAAPAVRGPFFASLQDRDATRQALRALDPGFESKLRERADRALGGSFDLLGHRDLSFGNPVDWWLEPVAGVRTPDRHWSGIDFLDPAQVGDHKVVWELSRHNALLTMAQAYWCTGESRYAEHCLAQLASWLDANPPKRGVHWSSSLELAFRANAWLWILALLDDVLQPDLRRRLLTYIAIAGRHIERHLSTWFSPNTHLTGEALGLFMIGTALPHCRDAALWRSRGAEILLEWLNRHVRPDGTYVEQSTWYHRYTTDFYLQFLILAERAGMNIRPALERPLNGLVDYLMWISRPDGTMPLIGDDDGGRLLFLDERTAHDVRSPLAIGAALFARADLAAVSGAPTAELVWLLGKAGSDAFSRVAPEAPDSTARLFRDGGTAVVRSGWDASASVMTIDGGPHGFLNAGHAHADALSIDLTVGGQSVLVDPGTFTYTVSPSWRDQFRETSMHNAATVDGCGSAAVAGPFQWATRAESRVEQWEVNEDERVVLFAGSHDGFERLRPPVRYTRLMAYIQPDLWVIRDEIAGDGEHELAVHWQCAPGLHCHGGAGSLTLSRGRTEVLGMYVVEDAAWRFTDGWASPTYGARESATHVTCAVRGINECHLTTLLHAPGHLISASPDMRDGKPALRVRWKERHGLLFFANRRVSWTPLNASPEPTA